MYCINTATGKEVWATHVGASIYSTAVLSRADGGKRVFVPVTDGSVVAFEASTGSVLWRYSLPAAVASEPVLSIDDSMLVVGCHDGVVYTIYTATNFSQSTRIVWSAVAGKHCTQDPLHGCSVQSDGVLSLDGKVVFTASDDGIVYALRMSDGVAVWTLDTGVEPVQCGLTLSSDSTSLFFGSFGGKIWRVNATTGGTLWTFDTQGPVGSKPVLSSDDSSLFQGSFDGYFYALNASDGDLLWQYNTNGAVHSDPAVDNDQKVVFGASYSGELFALSQSGKPVDLASWSVT